MRIISQNGKFDVPYEQSMVIVNGTMIHVQFQGNQQLFATYSTKEKAQKAVKNLRTMFDSYEFMKISANEEILANMKLLLSESDFEKITSSIFCFPADDGIKVEA